MKDDEIRYCRTCKQALEMRTIAGVRDYWHVVRAAGAAADHEPDPVPVTELPGADIRCDFCSASAPSWSYLCDNITTRDREVIGRKIGFSDYRLRNRGARSLGHVFGDSGLTVHNGERWAACETCAELIEARDMPALITRALEVLPARMTRGKRLIQSRANLYQLYEPMFATLLPGRSPITPDDPLGLKAAPAEDAS